MSFKIGDFKCEEPNCGKDAIYGINEHYFCKKHFKDGLEKEAKPIIRAIHKNLPEIDGS